MRRDTCAGSIVNASVQVFGEQLPRPAMNILQKPHAHDLLSQSFLALVIMTLREREKFPLVSQQVT